MKEEYKGYQIDIEQDQDVESPREWDNLGKMVMFHSRYNLPNEIDLNKGSSWDEIKEEIKKQGAKVILPVYMHEHSGISLRTTDFNDRFDSGMIGFIFANDLEGLSKEQVEENLKNEVETYSQYLNGDVYYYTISKQEFCRHCGVTRSDTIDSCGGFYGSDEALKEAKSYIDNL